MVLVGQRDQDLRDHVAVGAQGDLLVGHAAHQRQGRQPGAFGQGFVLPRPSGASPRASGATVWRHRTAGLERIRCGA